MTRRLLILQRHAKAAPHGADGDRGRPLLEEGRAQARRAGVALRRSEIIPPAIPLHLWVSPATRTVETADEMMPFLPDETTRDTVSGLYDADAQGLFGMVRRAPESVAAIMVVGHNPTIAEAATSLAGPELDEGAVRVLLSGYPTGTICAFAVTGGWDSVVETPTPMIYCNVP